MDKSWYGDGKDMRQAAARARMCFSLALSPDERGIVVHVMWNMHSGKP